MSNIGRGKLNGRKKKKKTNKQTNKHVVNVGSEHFSSKFRTLFSVQFSSHFRKIEFDGLRKEKKTSPTIFLSPSPSQLNTPPTKGKRRGYLNFPKAPLPSIIMLKF